jgi:hypothetical protein
MRGLKIGGHRNVHVVHVVHVFAANWHQSARGHREARNAQ